MTNVASTMQTEKAKAKRRAHFRPSIDFFAPAAKPRIAPIVDTRSEARMMRRPREAVMSGFLGLVEDRRPRLSGQAGAPVLQRQPSNSFLQPLRGPHQP